MPGQQPAPPGRVVLVKKFVMRDGATVGAQVRHFNPYNNDILIMTKSVTQAASRLCEAETADILVFSSESLDR